jgi:stress-induced morphogen
MIAPEEVEKLLTAAFPEADIRVQDLKGSMDHYRVAVITETFTGKRLVQRHQAVNEALKEPLKGPLHALTIEAFTPEEWVARGNKPAEQPRGPVPQGIKL